MEEKFIKFIIIAIVALFASSMACANTYSYKLYYAKTNNGKEYVIDSLCTKVYKLGTVAVSVPSAKKQALAKKTENENENHQTSQSNGLLFDNLSKFGFCILGIMFITLLSCGFCAIIYFFILFYKKFFLKKR